MYAPLGAFISAKIHFGAGDLKTARAQLAGRVENARDPGVQALARLRLANVLLDEKDYDEALKVLAVKPEPTFEALFEDLRGDVLAAQGKGAEARAAYTAALGKLKPRGRYRARPHPAETRRPRRPMRRQRCPQRAACSRRSRRSCSPAAAA